MDTPGTFIVVEGTDGSGKSTQFKLLQERLTKAGYDVATFKFPQYDEPSSHFVREYLNGKYGSAEEVGPYTGSLFYALDRYAAAPKLREALAQGKVILVDRFVGSNMAHQGTKFRHAEERRGYFIWLDNLEFEMLRIPRPTMSIVLRVPAETAQQLIDQHDARTYTDKKRDIHEADLSHLQRAVEVYDDMCQLFPKDFTRIDCVRDGKLMDIPTIHELIWQKVQPMLPEPPKATPVPVQTAIVAPERYHTPERLEANLKKQYRATLDQIINLCGEMTQKLNQYLQQNATPNNGATLQAEALAAVRAVLPLATVTEESDATQIHAPLAKVAKQSLPSNHADVTPAVQLVDVTPRNEFDLVADALYPSSTLSLRELQAAVAEWPYEQKAAALETAVQQDISLPARYTWDFLCGYDTYRTLAGQSIGEHVQRQAPTPRYGYEVPSIIEAADLVDQFEACFDLSLRLYSALQAAGHEDTAHLATLRGHRMRWSAVTTPVMTVRIQQLLTQPAEPGSRVVLASMAEQLAQVHPLLSEAATSSQQAPAAPATMTAER